MNHRDLGRVSISSEMILNHPEQVAEVFALLKFIPIHAEHKLYNNDIEYVALSERFEEVQTGCIIPYYQLNITQDKCGKVNLVEVEQVDNI